MKKRYTEKRIIKSIKDHEAGVKVDDICRYLGISIGTLFYNWRSKYAGMEVNTLLKMRSLELVFERNRIMITKLKKLSLSQKK